MKLCSHQAHNKGLLLLVLRHLHEVREGALRLVHGVQDDRQELRWGAHGPNLPKVIRTALALLQRVVLRCPGPQHLDNTSVLGCRYSLVELCALAANLHSFIPPHNLMFPLDSLSAHVFDGVPDLGEVVVLAFHIGHNVGGSIVNCKNLFRSVSEVTCVTS